MGDGSSLFPRAYNSIGRFIINNVMESIRHLVEKTDQLRVFNIARSYSGGTGSGLGSLIVEYLDENYSKIILSETNIFNAGLRDSPTLEPYNALFGIESSCSCSGITVLYNNKALQNICFNRLGIKQPLFVTYNQLIAYSISGIYSTERFPGYGNCNIDSVLTNLIPYPRIQFPVCTLAPITRKEIIKYEKYSAPSDLVGKVISNDYVMFDTNLNSGSYISCCMIYRGMVSPGNIAQSHQDLLHTKKLQFIEWNPNSIKNGHSPLGLVDLPNFDFGVSQLSMLMLANHTNINVSFAEQTLSVHIMLKKKAFLHWFYEYGIEEDDFRSALENLILLNLDYKDIEKVSVHDNSKLIDELNKRKTKKFPTKKTDNLFTKRNKKSSKTIKSIKAEMLYNKPIENEEILSNKFTQEESDMLYNKPIQSEAELSVPNDDNEEDDTLLLESKKETNDASLSREYDFQCKITTDSDEKNLNLDLFLNEPQASLSIKDNDEEPLHNSFHPSNEENEIQNQSIKSDDVVQLENLEDSSIKSVTNIISNEIIASKKKREKVQKRIPKRKRKSKSVLTSIKSENAKKNRILTNSKQLRCSLSLFKTYEESFIQNISPKISPVSVSQSCKTSGGIDCLPA